MATTTLAQRSTASGDRFGRGELLRVGTVVGIMLGVYAAHGFIDDVRGSSYIEAARTAARPDVSPPDPSAADLQHIIESGVGSHAVLLSDRVDVLALYPNHAFVVWDAHYAHPASEFGRRIEFLTQLSRSDDPSAFRALIEHNPDDTIDALVLRDDGDALVFTYGADAFPAGLTAPKSDSPRRCSISSSRLTSATTSSPSRKRDVTSRARAARVTGFGELENREVNTSAGRCTRIA